MATDWKARLDAARAVRAQAEAQITDDDKAEIQGREEEARELAAAADAARKKRDLDLAREVDGVRAELGPKAKIAPVSIDEYEDRFVVVHDPAAFAEWEKSAEEARGNKKIDKAEVARNFAVAAAHLWNGREVDTVVAYELTKHLEEHPGMVTPIINEAAKLAGFFAEARKRGG